MSKFTEYRNATWAWIKDKSGKVYAAAKANAVADPWGTAGWTLFGAGLGWIAHAVYRIFS